MVYVLNSEGKPLMPTLRHGKVRRMLRDGRATVVRRCPFTVRLTYGTPGHVQRVSLGVDAGTAHVGLSATTEKRELFSAEVELRTDIVNLLSTRREARRARRGRKTRYREPRFDHRNHAEFTPSVEQKINSHLDLIGRAHSILPISRTVIEVAQFDQQKINNPDISGAEYQQGDQLGFENVREYVLARDGHICQGCHGKSKDPVLNIHHIESRKTGGDSPSNLVTLCETCHDAYHRGVLKLDLKRSRTSQRDAAVMNTMRKEVYNRAAALWDNVHLTYGYITKHTRIHAGLEKSHRADARCISGNPLAEPCGEWFKLKQRRRHNRKIHKANPLSGGRRKNNQSPYLVKGFRLFDKVEYDGQECFIFGRRARGFFNIRLIDGTVIHKDVSCKKLRFVEVSRSYLITLKREPIRFPVPAEAGSTLG